MSDNKFEKQVQQKMDELKLSPSREAWENIETKLRIQKRPHFSLWMAALLVLVAGSSYFIYDSLYTKPASFVEATAKNEVGQSDTPPIDQIDDSSIQLTPPALKASPVDNGQEQFNKANKDNEQHTGPLNEQGTRIVSGHVTASSDQLYPVARNKKTNTSKENTSEISASVKEDLAGIISGNKTGDNGSDYAQPDGYVSPKNISAPQKNNSKTLPPAGDVDDNAGDMPLQPGVENGSGKAENNSVGDIKDHALKGQPEKNNHKPGVSLQEDSVKSLADNIAKKSMKKTAEKKGAIARVNKSKNNHNGWQLGVSASSGLSLVSDGPGLKLSQPMVQDASVSTGFMAPGPLYTPYTPSAIKPGMTYSIGATLRREISKRIYFSIGLSYLQYNTHTRVGDRINRNQIVNSGTRGYQNVVAYYLNDRVRDYSNRYHFIDLPIDFHFQINKSESLPFYVNAGVHMSRLISSNSLHFDGTTGVYYRNDKLLNRMQTGLSAGLSLALFNKSSTPLWIGPSFRYNVSPLLQRDVSENKRLVSPAIDVKWFFSK